MNKKIVLAGGAGLVGQNLAVRLKSAGYTNVVIIDHHPKNLESMASRFPEYRFIRSDLGIEGPWQAEMIGCEVLIMLQAQIGGLDYAEFVKNNVRSTELLLRSAKEHGVSRIIPISSSVVVSKADDYYTRSKREQEKLVLESGVLCPVLRPTLMFGWFDRKHLGWLARFMLKVPIFPIPGLGNFMRQPLYVGDFCDIIMACMSRPEINGVFNITGQEKITYIEMIRSIHSVIQSRSHIIRIPYKLFYFLLWTYALIDRNPPFTTQQLSALVADDEFEVINWPKIFGVRPTAFRDALRETFCHPQYSKVTVDF